jgi:DNA primase
VQEVQERAIEGRLRELRAQIAEAERNADFAGLALLTQKKLELDRVLRKIHRNNEKSI